ncbi:lysM domain receptor-like kinase 3 [Actinidia eriantha]|uniref:lysM domain receptor-like kinase 3 n=1 Tax=Actinidia eriantha TaxID=165200 RepID=UPI00258D36A3|nr:lysM domain receptor-like kinase 3 [Actinidia eriantha]XP_057495610.1 lysM domain receptor-like kinase 3 [Actinidia eriantha]XP_057495611.1 lysM domain receptor-like kinase 3 [Actinidia eriantha]
MTERKCNSHLSNFINSISSSLFPSHDSIIFASMARKVLLSLLFLPLLTTLIAVTASQVSIKSTGLYAFPCSDRNKTCTSLLYQHNGLRKDQIATFYSVNTSQISTISHSGSKDFFVTVPCSCKQVNSTAGLTEGYFYRTFYKLQQNDTFVNVSSQIYSGQAWEAGGEEDSYVAGEVVPIDLLCGCVESDSQIMVTYTVQLHDTLSDIAIKLAARTSEIEKYNRILNQNPGFIDVGWVLFVPMETNGISPEKAGSSTGKGHKWTILVGILSAVALLLLCTLAIILFMRNRYRKNSEKDMKTMSKSFTAGKLSSLQRQYTRKERMEDVTAFETERAVIFSLEEIEEATYSFDETRKIGEGGYGSVYFGVIGEQEVAVKKMRSNKSKEFFAELKVLCKIHHINVVELLGYASGDDHLYLVYEYIQNGSLSDHLHDPLLKGYQPLSWTVRAQIALDTAKGIEYIHDHTKARYVHRDIKTSNILLDEGPRAKVADFGLAKLVGRANEDDFIATRLVGTPGYLPPESVKELQVTTKTDVFAFGVVVAELITGQRALIRDNREPNKMKSLITVISKIFKDEEPEAALESVIDGNLKGSYPMEDVYKMAEIAEWCLSEDAVNRPEMREIVVALSQIVVSSTEWEASLGGDSHVFSGLFSGR